MRSLRAWAALGPLGLLVACGGTGGAGSTTAAARPAYLGTGGGAYVAPGWKAGDATSWEETIRARTQAGQNEYLRSAGRP